MKKFVKLFGTLLLTSLIALPVFTACDNGEGQKPADFVDYVGMLHLDMSSNTKKQEVTVKTYIDGDTTHFDPVKNSTLTSYNAADFEATYGYIKARYLAVNTPESTGHIEKWGKTASDFTYGRLNEAESIIVESDDAAWNIDSTGERYMLWIWYKPKDGTEYRNLNVEILQEGLALASSTANNRYGEIASAALAQAEKLQRYVYAPANVKDPNFFEGEAIKMDLKYLRCHIDDYLDKAVRVEGVVTAVFDNSAYIESYDEETGLYFGMAVYYGFETGELLHILSLGNLVSVRGTVAKFPAQATENFTYQISGVDYDVFRPKAEKNTILLESGKTGAFTEMSGKQFQSSTTVDVRFEEEDEEGEAVFDTVTLPYAELCLNSSVSVKGLTVTGAHATQQGDSVNALTLTCKAEDGSTVSVRCAAAFYDADGKLLTESDFVGKKINVKGILDKYYGNYQVKVPAFADIEFMG